MQTQYPLLSHNTFGIAATARYFAEYDSPEQLEDTLRTYYALQQAAPTSAKILHIGAGSNLLFLSDYEGLVLHSAIRGIEILKEDEQHVCIRVGAGEVWDDLVAWTLKHEMYGLENLSLIPGEVGAAAVQNIGAYGMEAKDFITLVHLFDLKTMERRAMTNVEMAYAYRFSALKSEELRGRYAVTHVELRLNKSFTPHLDYGGLRSALVPETDKPLTAEALRNAIIQMRKNKLPDPRTLGNAGSFFMNPVVEKSLFERLLNQYPAMPHYEVDATHVKIPAGWLIEQAGWKGRALGKAGVYERQALVLVNLGGATGQDIVRLCKAVQADVQAKFGIDIRPEVNFI